MGPKARRIVELAEEALARGEKPSARIIAERTGLSQMSVRTALSKARQDGVLPRVKSRKTGRTS